MSDALPRLSRALLLPEPLPPLSHFGLTLLRHGVVTGLRYALYQLGLPLPEAPPVRLVRLRLYLEARPLLERLEGRPGGREVAAALLDPGGAGGLPAAAGALVGAVRFHRWRLRWPPLRRPLAGPAGRLPRPADRRSAADGKPGALWEAFRGELSALARPLGEALLADLVASLERRAARAAGREAPPGLSRQAWRLRTGRRARLDLFGPPDPLASSWAAEPERAARALAALAGEPVPPPHPLRGRFRLAWRAALDRLTPRYRALAEEAAARGLLREPEEAFFLPLDVASDLALPRQPRWLPEAVTRNRAEHRELLAAAEPADLQHGRLATRPADPEAWEQAPLLSLA